MARILAIDDEEVVRLAVATTLRRFQHDVSVAPDGESGVGLFREQIFDLVITDVNMPGLSGPQVIREIRILRPGIPVIIMGGGGSIPPLGPELFAEHVGANRALVKPFAMSQLVAAVAELVDEARVGKG